MVDISIIISVYNAEKYLDRCLKSIISQTFKNFEVIIVDDGSVDSSYQICLGYSSADNRIKVIHQENQGPSVARNTALGEVKGKYLCFVDSDDCYSSNNALQILYNEMEKTQADVCIFSWNRISADGHEKKYEFTECEMMKEPHSLIKVLMRGHYRGGGGNPWNKIWRIDSLRTSGSIHLFEANIQIFEDMLWVIQGIKKINNIVFLNKALYQYYILDSSISRDAAPVVRGKKYVDGASYVYSYICENCSYAKNSALYWYRDKFSSYLMKKYRARIKLTDEEKHILRSMSLNPCCNLSFRMWRRILFLKLFGIFDIYFCVTE